VQKIPVPAPVCYLLGFSKGDDPVPAGPAHDLEQAPKCRRDFVEKANARAACRFMPVENVCFDAFFCQCFAQELPFFF